MVYFCFHFNGGRITIISLRLFLYRHQKFYHRDPYQLSLHPVLRSLEIRTILAPNADRRRPASRKRRQHWQFERRRRKRERGLGCRRPNSRYDDTKCGERGGQPILLRTARSAGRGFVEILHCRPLTPDALAGRLVWLGALPLLRQRCPKIAGRTAARTGRWTRTLQTHQHCPNIA